CHPALERLAVDAEVALAPERLTASAKVEGTGLQLAALQAYLPPSLRAEPGARVLGVELAVRADPAEAGGQALALDVRRVRLARTDAEEPELGIGSVEVRVARADPEAGVFAIDVAAVRGIQAEVVQTEDGTAIGGVCLLARAEERPPEAAPVAEAAPVEAAAPRAAVAMPDVTVGRLAFEVERLRVRDARDPQRPPIDLTVALSHEEPLHLLAQDLEGLPPQRLTVRGAAAPLLGEIGLDLEAAPFAADPRLVADLRLAGFDPAALCAWVPALREQLDPEASTARELAVKATAHLRVPRGGLLAFDPRDGFGAEVDVEEFAVRAAPDAPPAFGIGRVHVEVQRIEPVTG